MDNKNAIAELEDALKARACELAEDKLKGDRGFLDSDPEGVPLGVLPLDEDRQFHELETRRAALKAKDPVRNAAAIKGLEDELNGRAHELALEQIAEDLRGVENAPRGIPIELLKPHEDPQFAAMVDELRSMKKDPRTDPAALSSLEAQMNERVDELAGDLLEGDRGYLNKDPLGVPLELLPLSTDPDFHALEVQRAVLKAQDPRRNAAQIADLENKLDERAVQLADEQRRRELYELDE
ncbi:hypothetical protein LSM04_002264, partial [Trypanosoma melophagium]|uniref:uncharacterized protein n=1 Tax=Trypanosoma melophagium TaxID=715481 RepID=UPI00351AB063